LVQVKFVLRRPLSNSEIDPGRGDYGEATIRLNRPLKPHGRDDSAPRHAPSLGLRRFDTSLRKSDGLSIISRYRSPGPDVALPFEERCIARKVHPPEVWCRDDG